MIITLKSGKEITITAGIGMITASHSGGDLGRAVIITTKLHGKHIHTATAALLADDATIKAVEKFIESTKVKAVYVMDDAEKHAAAVERMSARGFA